MMERLSRKEVDYVEKAGETKLERLPYEDRHHLQPFRGDIFFANLESLYGQKKKARPVLVISNNIGNYYRKQVIVAVCSTSMKKDKIPTHVEINIDSPSVVATEHLITIPKDRLMGFIRRATEEEMQEVDKALGISIGLIKIESNK